MRVQDLMTCDVQCCGLEDDLGRAAQIMWEEDCGIVPVLRDDGGLAGVITDRDVCMAAWSKGRPPSAIRVGEAMARDVVFCAPEDDLGAAMVSMRRSTVRRLPVIDEGGLLVGILSLCDLAVEADRQLDRGGRQVPQEDFLATVAAISRPRRSRAAELGAPPLESVAKPVRQPTHAAR